MLDEARKLDSAGGDFVELVRTGALAAGVFRCSDCGYGVTVQAALPRCPMCGGKSWERAPSGAYAPEWLR